MNYYIDLFSPETALAFEKSDKQITGFRITQKTYATNKKIGPGDRFICYVTEVQRFVGLLEVTSGPFEDTTPIFTKEKDPFTLRFKVKTIVWLPLENAIPIHSEQIWKKLSFTKGLPTNSYLWTHKVAASPRLWDPQDCSFIESLLMEQNKKLVVYPLSKSAAKKTPKAIGDTWHRRVSAMLNNMGFTVEDNFSGAGPDIVARIPIGQKTVTVIIQCKNRDNEADGNKRPSYPSLENLIYEYSGRRNESEADAAVIALGGYNVPNSVDPKQALEKERVAIWTDRIIKYYEELSAKIATYAKYQLLSDLGVSVEFAEPKKFPCLKVTQNGISFYIFSVEPEWLMRAAYVARRVDPQLDGNSYQRLLTKKRIAEDLPSFFSKDNWVLPNSIICASRAGVDFHYGDGFITLKSSVGSFWVMDGQHRLYGFSNTEERLRETSQIVCAAFDSGSMGPDAWKKQAEIFVELNYHAKAVTKTLLSDIKILLGTQEISLGAAIRMKNSKIFKGKIKTYAEGSGTINIVTLAYNQAMSELTRDDGPLLPAVGSGAPLTNEEKEKKCADALLVYFGAVKKVFGGEWDSKDCALATDKGVRGLLKLFQRIIKYSGNTIDEEKIVEILEALKNAEPPLDKAHFKNQYAGEGGANKLASEWSRYISHGIADFDPTVQQRCVAQLVVQPNHPMAEIENTLRQWFQHLTGDVRAVLMHIDPTTIDFLNLLPLKKISSLRIFFSDSHDEEKVKEKLRELKKLNPKIIFTKAKKATGGSLYHGRWIANDAYRVSLEADLKKDHINKSAHTKSLDSWSNSADLLQFENYWEQAARLRFDFDWQ